MSEISSDMLHNTLQMISLARQSAVNQGENQKAEMIAPVEERLRNIVEPSRIESEVPVSSPVERDAGFQHMLKIKEQNQTANHPGYDQDRNHIIQSMAAAGMSEVEIARQMGITSEEVEIVVQLGRR